MASHSAGSPTTQGGWTAAILRALEARGIDAKALAAEAGVSLRVLEDGNLRVPRVALTKLWKLAVEATGDPAFGLGTPRYAALTSFHALGYAMLASATLREAIERVIRHRRLIGDVLQAKVIDLGPVCRIEIDVSAPPGAPYEAVDAIFAAITQQVRFLTQDRRVRPIAVRLQRPEPRDPAPYLGAFQCETLFGQQENAVDFDREEMDRPLPSANAELARQNDQAVVSYLATLGRATFGSRVEEAILSDLPNGTVSQTRIARRLGMSARSLQRRLAEDQTSFQALLDQARANLARAYVKDGSRTITEIAFLLGFGDASAFSRAFKRWTGESPLAQRRLRKC